MFVKKDASENSGRTVLANEEKRAKVPVGFASTRLNSSERG